MKISLVVALATTLAMFLILPVALMTPCDAGESTAEANKPPHPDARTVVLDTDDVRPGRVTLAKGEGLTFLNTRLDMVKVRFHGKGDLAKRIRCAVPEGRPLGRGPAMDEIMAMEGDELRVFVAAGQFPAVCTFAAGSYTFDVIPEVGLRTDEVPPQGQVVAR